MRAIIEYQNINTSTAIAGEITVTTAGTPVQGPDVALINGVFVKPLAGNTGVGKVGTSGAVKYELSPGEPTIVQVANLNELYFDVTTSGNKWCWMKA